MFADLKKVGLVALSLCLVAGLTGCPLWPFSVSTTGTYGGTWNADILGSPVTCPLTMSFLTQVGPVVAGTVTFNYACFLPQELINAFDPPLSDFTVPVIGTVQCDGSLTLTFDPGAVLPPEFSIVITYDGTGEDTTTPADGVMDAYDGTFSLTWTLQTDVPGFANFEIVVEGGYTVTLTP